MKSEAISRITKLKKRRDETFNVKSILVRFYEVKKAELIDKREEGETR